MTLLATPLSTIIALARAGALEHAWYRFAAAGYERVDDPAALNVKGRLLKDRALRAQGEDRRRLYLASAEAYRRSAALQPGTYPLINAATLSLLAGDRSQAAEIACEVLERIEREPDEPETPYWRGATVAEALLLVGRVEEAKVALVDALAAAPRAWEDHASTLRQFILIQAERDADAEWLDVLRPPRSLAWSGSNAAVDAAQEDQVRRRVADVVSRERIGFAFGVPGAGAGIVAAEAALEAGAELHLVLPGGSEAFAAAFVEPAGPGWRRRFDALAEAAEGIHMVRPIGGSCAGGMLALAAEIAAGAARLNAERLMSGAFDLQLCADVTPPMDDAGGMGVPLALLAVTVGAADEPGFAERLAAVRDEVAVHGQLAVPGHLAGDDVVFGFNRVDQAAGAARTIHARLRHAMSVRIAGHFGFIPLLRDPFLDAARPSEGGAKILNAIRQAAPPDTVCVSVDFAAALAAGEDGPSCAHWIGELHAFDGGTAIALYALRPLPSGD